MMWRTLILALAIAGCVFFLVRAFQLSASRRSMSQVEIKRIELDAARERAERLTLRQTIHARVRALGYDGDLFPVAAGLAFLYLAVTVAVSMTPAPPWVAYAVGLPLSFLIVVGITKSVATRKHKKFNGQLVELLELVAGQIEGGTGAQRALTIVVPTMQEPLRSEMSHVLDVQIATKDLIGAMRELAGRYPSRAFELFISALEIDRADGHAIGPALRQAAGLLNDDFKLRSEALAEVAQQRGEFFIILGILGALGAYMIFGGDTDRAKAYMSPFGLIALSAALGNVGVGVWRMLSVLRKLQGDEPL